MCKRVYLSNCKFALVDDDDFDLVSQFVWSYSNGYAQRRSYERMPDGTVRRQTIMMHRFIAGTPSGFDTDHRNRNGLDNRRRNLRTATRSQNNANKRCHRSKTTSQYKGVFWHKRDRVWWSQIEAHGKKTYLGRFNSELEAAQAYDQALFDVWGEFANLNFPELIPVYSQRSSLPR